MKKSNIRIAALIIVLFSSIGYAEMGKCNGMKESKMKMMESDFSAKKSMMQNNLIKAKECVDTAKSTQELNNCKMVMMQKKQEMMEQKKEMMQNNQGMMNMDSGMMQKKQEMMSNKQEMMEQKQEMMQNNQGMMNMDNGMMQNRNMQQNTIEKIKECVNAATTLQEIQNCKVGMMQ